MASQLHHLHLRVRNFWYYWEFWRWKQLAKLGRIGRILQWRKCNQRELANHRLTIAKHGRFSIAKARSIAKRAQRCSIFRRSRHSPKWCQCAPYYFQIFESTMSSLICLWMNFKFYINDLTRFYQWMLKYFWQTLIWRNFIVCIVYLLFIQSIFAELLKDSNK